MPPLLPHGLLDHVKANSKRAEVPDVISRASELETGQQIGSTSPQKEEKIK